jgi:hypothetical protein
MKEVMVYIVGFLVIVSIIFLTVKIRGKIHYNLYYKNHVTEIIQPLENRILELEKRIDILEKND